MPELPEVQTIVDDLNTAGLPGLLITDARVFWPRSIFAPNAETFCKQVKGKRLSAVWRRGKYLVFDFCDGGHLLMHLRMSGRLHLVAAKTERSCHEHVILRLGDHRELRFHDPRKFGRVYLVDRVHTVLDRLGPEPMGKGFTVKALTRILGSRKRMLKPLLLDQTIIAGLGNIYTDESLWEARIHPCRSGASLSDREVKSLHRAIPLVLKRGLRNLGTSLGTGKTNFYSIARRRGRNRDELKVFRRTDLPCPRCETPIQRIVVVQRSTHVCPRCQPFQSA
jgi:formamidopyrimidine-DNA glycosylase